MCIFILSILVILGSAGQIWYFIGIGALLSDIALTFIKGNAYLKNRSTILGWDKIWVNTLRPIIYHIGIEESWLLSFCNWNNYRTVQAFQNNKAKRVLLLLPRCIQMARCNADILHDLGKCYNCGLCDVSNLQSLQVKYNIKSYIHNRSHKTYKCARQYKPDLIIAVSCLDRLIKGLIRLPEIPSYVIPLELNHGMCVNTNFNTNHLATILDTLVDIQHNDITNSNAVIHNNQMELIPNIGMINIAK